MILCSSPKRLIHCCESSLLFRDGSYCPPEGILDATPFCPQGLQALKRQIRPEALHTRITFDPQNCPDMALGKSDIFSIIDVV